VVGPRKLARGLLGLWLGVVVAACGGAHGHWADPDVRLVDGMWTGRQIACPPARDECATISSGAQAGLSDTERSLVAKIVWVALPTQFVTDAGEPRTPRSHVALATWVAALVTMKDGRERVVGLACEFWRVPARCDPSTLADWRDGAIPPSFAPGTVVG
jgi:hypothetical protein